MRPRHFLATLIVLSPATLFAADAKEERASMVGHWHVTAMTADGQSVPPGMFKQVPWNWVIGKDKVVSKRPGRGGRVIYNEEIRFELDPNQKPKALGFVDVSRKRTSKGIYNLSGDTLTICIPMEPTGNRPTDFSAAKGSKRVLIVMKRDRR